MTRNQRNGKGVVGSLSVPSKALKNKMKSQNLPQDIHESNNVGKTLNFGNKKLNRAQPSMDDLPYELSKKDIRKLSKNKSKASNQDELQRKFTTKNDSKSKVKKKQTKKLKQLESQEDHVHTHGVRLCHQHEHQQAKGPKKTPDGRP